MQIRIKPQLLTSSNGFDSFNRAVSKVDAVNAINIEKWYNTDGTVPEDVIVHWMEKHSLRVSFTPVLTKSGKPSTKPAVKNVVPTHWKYKVWVIPAAVVALLKADGKKIVQYKHHWSIEDVSK
jgi:hypothetical protein